VTALRLATPGVASAMVTKIALLYGHRQAIASALESTLGIDPSLDARLGAGKPLPI
jgi:threonine/homoserine/homoserine lactone efflux protein